MKSQKLLLELIGLVGEFEDGLKDDQEAALPDFLGFLNARDGSGDVTIRNLTGGQAQQMVADHSTPEIEISRLISVMYRYAKGYIKKALKNSSIQTADEFTFIIILMTHTSLSKTELINKNIMEKTTGTEVIKRLVKRGLIEQFSDAQDKRSQQVAVTNKGREEIYAVLPNMTMVSTIVAGNLTRSEKNTLAYLLKKLDYHHHELYTSRKDEDLAELAGQ
jgi:DNA-binding MarR family transcriptional regulator